MALVESYCSEPHLDEEVRHPDLKLSYLRGLCQQLPGDDVAAPRHSWQLHHALDPAREVRGLR